MAQIVKNLPARQETGSILGWVPPLGWDLGSTPGLGRSLGDGNGYLLQYSYLENSMDRERSLVGYSPWGHKESDMTELPSSYEVGLVLATCHTQKTMIFSQKKNKKPMLNRWKKFKKIGGWFWKIWDMKGPEKFLCQYSVVCAIWRHPSCRHRRPATFTMTVAFIDHMTWA